jgi:hypothetical protein
MANRKPIDYKQYDSKWAKVAYNGPGESDKTIKSSGCGPTSAAMLIATLADKSVTPVTTCAWSVAHGYKYANQGTAYSYFKPQFAEYGIICKQLLSSRIINKPNHEIHDQVKKYLSQGYYIIALMGPGTWTTGGHYVVVWDWDDKVRINDSMSTKEKRLNGDPYTFRNEVRNYWLVDAREYNGFSTATKTTSTGTSTSTATSSTTVTTKPATSTTTTQATTITTVKKEDDIMTGEEIYKALQEYLATQPLPSWAEAEFQEAKDLGITDGSAPMQLIPRYQAAMMAKRAAKQ